MALRYSRLLLMAVLLFFWRATLAADITIFGDDNYPPVIYRDQSGQPNGLLVEVLQQYQQHTGQTLKLKLMPWKRAYKSAESGMGGIIGLSKTQARLAIFDYSDPIHDDDIHIVVLQGHEFDFRSLADLRGRLIGTQLGASFGTEVDAAIATGQIQVDPDPVHANRLRKLLRGRIDAAFIGNGKQGFEKLLSSDAELHANRDRFVLLPTPLVRDPLYLGFAKTQHMGRFLANFNQVLKQLKTQQSAKRQTATGTH